VKQQPGRGFFILVKLIRGNRGQGRFRFSPGEYLLLWKDIMATLAELTWPIPDAATPVCPSEAGIAELAESRLRSNSYLALKNVSCEYQQGRMILHGCLPTYYLKQLAQEVVARVDGVGQIVNQISVLESVAACARRT
jgi:BON domain